ncbi:MAG: cytidylate kinase-like family protein [Bacilli bacterium]|nr:cytidylate kinase-like family protein [Bacilli bacterium]
MDKKKDTENILIGDNVNENGNFNKIITISREYGSGGRFVAKVLGEKLGIKVYDAELIRLTSKETGFSLDYVQKNDQLKNNYYENDDRMFIADKNVIKKLAKNPCIIVGRCADYILSDHKNVVKIFLYSDEKGKMNRAVKYYGLNKNNARKEITRINKMHAKHYKYYTNREWMDLSNYDALFNVDKFGIDGTVENIIKLVSEK